MSGQQIGTVIGGIIGAYFGAPQLGMAIGGLIGGAIDPTKIKGPHIGDGQQQQSSSGAPIAWVQGTAKIAGTLCATGPRREVKKTDGGKGGTEQVTYEAHQTYAFLVCESSIPRNSKISSILMIEQDGKLVYDMRSSATAADLAASAKFKAGVTFYFGDEDQMPPPELEAIFGVGKTPGYRGVLLVTFNDRNISQFGDRIPTYLFTVSNSVGLPNQQPWRYKLMLQSDNTNYSSPTFDDSSWAYGAAPFGSWSTDVAFNSHDLSIGAPNELTLANAYDANFAEGFATPWPANNQTGTALSRMWLRGDMYLAQVPPGGFKVVSYVEDHCAFYVNGVLAFGTPPDRTGGAGSVNTIDASYFVTGKNTLAVKCDDEVPVVIGAATVVYADFYMEPLGLDANKPLPVPLSQIVQNIAMRGGLKSSDIDVTALEGIETLGYPIATQCAATDALGPLLQAYFAFGTDCDSKILFKLYGEDATITINPDDAVVNDDTDGAIVRTRRNQATEFPKTFVVSYLDPDQRYNAVTTTSFMRPTTVVASGEMDIQIPVVMEANDAAQAADKAKKVAYATLEGTIELSVPFATASGVYLSLCAGEPFLMYEKRWVLDEVDICDGYLKLSGRYDRQSSYQSNVQAITGNPPTGVTSIYSGPTDLMVMQIPSLRQQDTYGVYLAARGTEEDNWKGCTIQISYDGQQSWQSALTMNLTSAMGQLTADEANDSSSSESCITRVNIGTVEQLVSVTQDQIDANANACCLQKASDQSCELRQFKTATLQSDDDYILTDQRTGQLDTPYSLHHTGDWFTMLDSVYFLPIDLSFKGKTLYIRAVGFNEDADTQPIQSFVYNPDTTVIVDGGVIT
jgi:hypothetical protein